ncbi:outer membrane protein [Bacteroidota bacterium]
MKRISIVLFSVIFILSINTNVRAQLVRIGVGGGITNITGPDMLTKAVSEGGSGYSTEYNFGIVGKIGLPLIPITPRALIIYHKFGGEGTQIPALPKGSSQTANVEFSQSILTLGAGVQYGFIPIPVGIDPYLSLDLTFNNMGELTTTIDGTETTIEGTSRTGLQIGAGAEISIIPAINLDIFAGYNLFNLIGKEDGEESMSAINVDIFLMFSFL